MAISLMISAWLAAARARQMPAATMPAPSFSSGGVASSSEVRVRHHLPPRVKQALRAPDQDHDHQAVDDESAQLGDVVLAGHVGNAQQQGRQQRTGDARGATHRHHDQEIDHELERKRRVQPQHFGTQPPPAPPGPEPTAKVDRNTTLTLMPRPAATRWSSTEARSGCRSGWRGHIADHRQRGTHGDDEQAVVPHAQHAPSNSSVRPLSHSGNWMICWVEPMK
jgi:hypothetical protein